MTMASKTNLKPRSEVQDSKNEEGQKDSNPGLGTTAASKPRSRRRGSVTSEGTNRMSTRSRAAQSEGIPRGIQDDVSDVPAESKDQKVGQPENTTGLAILPTELLNEIVSYLPQNESGLERLAFLRVLSQTCRSLRGYALPLCWETIEVLSCDSDSIKRTLAWKKALATDLVRQLEIVTIRDPSLAQYVKVVNVMMSSWSIKGVAQELARCLVLFPNLHTLQILGGFDSKDQKHFLNAFKDVTLPGVRTLVVGIPGAIPVINACPSVIHLIPVNCTSLLTVEDMGVLPCLEQLEYVNISVPSVMGQVINKFPRLKVVDLFQDTENHGHQDIPACLELMQELENLHCIRIRYRSLAQTIADSPQVPGPYYHVPAAAQKVLLASPPPEPENHKCIIEILPSPVKKHHLVLGAFQPRQGCPYL